MVGLSVSFCIADICRGKIGIEDVEKIIAGTRCYTPEHWDKVIDLYSYTYWREFPEKAVLILNQLIKEDKIDQPRISELTRWQEIPNIAGGHWLNDKGVKVWLY